MRQVGSAEGEARSAEAKTAGKVDGWGHWPPVRLIVEIVAGLRRRMGWPECDPISVIEAQPPIAWKQTSILFRWNGNWAGSAGGDAYRINRRAFDQDGGVPPNPLRSSEPKARTASRWRITCSKSWPSIGSRSPTFSAKARCRSTRERALGVR